MTESTLPPPADFIADTRVERAQSPGKWHCHLSDRWNAALFPFGGVVSAIAVRAMEAELAHPEHRIRSATTIYSSAIDEGALEIDVQRLRLGKRMSQLIANVRNAGSQDAGHTTVAIFGEEREAFDFTSIEPPEARSPEDSPLPEDPPEDYHKWESSFFSQLEVRMVLGLPPWNPAFEGGRAECIRWMRFRKPPILESGELDPVALVALSDTMPPAVGQYLGPDAPFFYAPSCDLTVHVLGTTREEWLLVQVTCAKAAGGYASARARIWDRHGVLLVEATQLMYLRVGEPEMLEGARPRA